MHNTRGESLPQDDHDRGRIDENTVERTENCDAPRRGCISRTGGKRGFSNAVAAAKDVNIRHCREKLDGGDCSRCSPRSADCRLDGEKVQVELPLQGDVEEETLLI